MASNKLTNAHPLLQHQFPIAKANFEKAHSDVQVVITCSYRSLAEQNKLYNQPFDHIVTA